MTVIRDWGTAIISSLANALNLLLTFIPRLLGFFVILLVGWIVATVISKALTAILGRVGFDRLAERIGLKRFEERMGISMDAASLLGKVVYWFVFLIFLVPAADALGLTAVSGVLNTLVNYIPNIFVAILVLFLGTLAATVVADLVRGTAASTRVGNPKLFANIVRYTIIGFAALIALEQLNIAPALINELFGGIVAATALAFGLAFGLGGRDSAQRLLNRAESSTTPALAQGNMQRGVPPTTEKVASINQMADVPRSAKMQ